MNMRQCEIISEGDSVEKRKLGIKLRHRSDNAEACPWDNLHNSNHCTLTVLRPDFIPADG